MMKLFGGGCSSSFQLQIILVVAVVCLIIYILYVTKDLVALERQVHIHHQQLEEQAKHIGILIDASAAHAKAAVAAAPHRAQLAAAPAPAAAPVPKQSTAGGGSSAGGSPLGGLPAPKPVQHQQQPQRPSPKQPDDDAADVISIRGEVIPDIAVAQDPVDSDDDSVIIEEEEDPVDHDGDKENEYNTDSEVADIIEDVIASADVGALSDKDDAGSAEDQDMDQDQDIELERELQRIKSLSWAELKLISKERGISSRSMNKEQLIQKLMQTM